MRHFSQHLLRHRRFVAKALLVRVKCPRSFRLCVCAATVFAIELGALGIQGLASQLLLVCRCVSVTLGAGDAQPPTSRVCGAALHSPPPTSSTKRRWVRVKCFARLLALRLRCCRARIELDALGIERRASGFLLLWCRSRGDGQVGPFRCERFTAAYGGLSRRLQHSWSSFVRSASSARRAAMLLFLHFSRVLSQAAPVGLRRLECLAQLSLHRSHALIKVSPVRVKHVSRA